MKNILKKNQIMITALAIMIAVAGYLNFAGTKLNDEELMKVSGQSVITEDNSEIANSDTGTLTQMDSQYEGAVLDISDEDMEAADASEQAQALDIQSMDTDELSANETPGEAVFTSAAGVSALSGAKLLKEQTRAKNKETLLDIINSESLAEEQKQTAVEGMIQLTDRAEKETAAEILLEAKGFSDVVVSIGNDGVDVVVNAASLTDAERAQIEDIVKRKTGTAAENIIISPVN